MRARVYVRGGLCVKCVKCVIMLAGQRLRRLTHSQVRQDMRQNESMAPF
jgi:hypothetical protein